MNYPDHITNHEKGKHLSFEDYVIIELRRKDGRSANAIAMKPFVGRGHVLSPTRAVSFIESHNGLIRRLLRKGKRTDSYRAEDIPAVELWANGLPRKILGYRTPDEVFEAEMNAIYDA